LGFLGFQKKTTFPMEEEVPEFMPSGHLLKKIFRYHANSEGNKSQWPSYAFWGSLLSNTFVREEKGTDPYILVISIFTRWIIRT
jgi:hypothetical protein